jgi:glycosyltransferase involved in cell wall biosynthesis
VHAQRWIVYFRARGYATRWLTLEQVPSGVEATKLRERLPRKAVSILLSIPAIRAEIRRFKPHIVNALFVPNYGWAGALAGFHPLVVSAWGSDVLVSPRKSWLHRLRVSWTVRRADLLFADAKVITERMIDLGAIRDRIVTVPLGVDPALLDFDLPQRKDPGVCSIITNRKFEPLYRNETLIEAAGIVENERPGETQFTLVGEGSARARLEKLVQEIGLSAVIRFHPFLPADQLCSALAGADVYVSCSESDGTSVSLLEAMALGLYPIVTDIPANREWITDGVNGRLFPVGDAQTLGRIVNEALWSRGKWPEVFRRNRDIVRARALWPDNMAVVERAMMDLISPEASEKL